jgi:putative copper resistance protein D
VYLGSPKALLASSYGLTLTTKLILVLAVLGAAYRNYRSIKPELDRLAASSEDEVERATPDLVWRFGRTLELEVTAGLLVIVVAGILGSVSPPNGPGQGLLTDRQISAVLSPELPATGFGDPKSWLGSSTRTPEDLAHAEFMHNWSGVAVVILALGWLLQCLGGRVGEQAGRIWPLFLIPFAIFVALFSDPDVWPVGDLGLISSLGNPLILEHRIGAAMIVVLSWLGLRDARYGGEERPLGRALPILMIVGSLLLLGHAHSSFASTDALATLIDVQHAVLGGLGLLAGVVRWLELRGLFPHSVARVLWPSLVLMLGLFLAFSYREMT